MRKLEELTSAAKHHPKSKYIMVGEVVIKLLKFMQNNNIDYKLPDDVITLNHLVMDYLDISI